MELPQSQIVTPSILLGATNGFVKACYTSHQKETSGVSWANVWRASTALCEGSPQEDADPASLVSSLDCLTWADDQNNSVFGALQTGVVVECGLSLSGKRRAIYQVDSNVLGRPRGLLRLADNDSTVLGLERGALTIHDAVGQLLHQWTTGPNICTLAQSPVNRALVATGGREAELKLWDINALSDSAAAADHTPTPVFVSKNVRHDQLLLRVPVWVNQAAFLPGSGAPCIAVATGHGHLRVYDPRSQRRPVLESRINMESARHSAGGGARPITAMALEPLNGRAAWLGTGAGELVCLDLRRADKHLASIPSLPGAVRALHWHPEEPVLYSACLDRHLRVHCVAARRLRHKIYLKSQLSCLLVSPAARMLESVDPAPARQKSMAPRPAQPDDKQVGEADADFDKLWTEMVPVKGAEISPKRSRPGAKNDVLKSSSNKRKRGKATAVA